MVLGYRIELTWYKDHRKARLQGKVKFCWGSHRNVYQHLRWGVTHKENMQFR